MCNRIGNISNNQNGVWYWQSDKNPSAHAGTDHWKPYTNEENTIIEDAFNDDKDCVGVGDYVVDFKRNVQYKITDNTKTRPVKRE